MSWQAYVDTNLVGTEKVKKAAILGQQGGVWAASKGYNLTQEEQNAIIKAFSNSDGVLASGLKLNGKKFFALQATAEHVHLKQGGSGAIIKKTKQAILVGEYDPPIQAPECNGVVEDLCKYLIESGY